MLEFRGLKVYGSPRRSTTRRRFTALELCKARRSAPALARGYAGVGASSPTCVRHWSWRMETASSLSFFDAEHRFISEGMSSHRFHRYTPRANSQYLFNLCRQDAWLVRFFQERQRPRRTRPVPMRPILGSRSERISGTSGRRERKIRTGTIAAHYRHRQIQHYSTKLGVGRRHIDGLTPLSASNTRCRASSRSLLGDRAKRASSSTNRMVPAPAIAAVQAVGAADAFHHLCRGRLDRRQQHRKHASGTRSHGECSGEALLTRFRAPRRPSPRPGISL